MSRRDYVSETGVRGAEAREQYSMEQLFSLEFSRPEPTGGRWFQFGPFGKAGAGRLVGCRHIEPDSEAKPRRTHRTPGSGSVIRKGSKWVACGPRVGSCRIHIGTFDTKEQAEAALSAWLAKEKR